MAATARRRGKPQDGAFDRQRVARVAPASTIGVSGAVVYGGYLQTQEKDATLQGRAKWKTYSELIANTSTIAAGVRLYLDLIERATWHFEPAETPRGKKIAELCEDILYDMDTPLHRVIRRSAMVKFYGFSISEWTAKRRNDGVVGLQDIEIRPQRTIERWDLDETGRVLGAIQVNPRTFEEIYLPRSKMFYLVDDTLDDTPEGVGLLRHCVRTAKSLEYFERTEGVGFETDLRGIPLIRAPLEKLRRMVEDGDLTEEKKAQLLEPINSFLANHIKTPASGVLLDSQVVRSNDAAETPSSIYEWAMELLQGGGGESLVAMATAIERKNREIARTLSAEHLLLGSDGKGSYALSEDKSDKFAMIVDSGLNEIAESMVSDLLRPLARMNSWNKEDLPMPKPERVRHKNITMVTGALRDLATAGELPGPPGWPAVDAHWDLSGQLLLAAFQPQAGAPSAASRLVLYGGSSSWDLGAAVASRHEILANRPDDLDTTIVLPALHMSIRLMTA